MLVVNIILAIILVVVVMIRLYLWRQGTEIVKVDASAAWELASRDEKSVLLQKKLVMQNFGTQCAAIMDAIVRPQLPYEQYDGMETRGRAERVGAPREDDYFEAFVLEGRLKQPNRVEIMAYVRLMARKGMSLEEAVSRMVDFNVDFIWQLAGRKPWRYEKIYFELTREELSSLTGIALKGEDE